MLSEQAEDCIRTGIRLICKNPAVVCSGHEGSKQTLDISLPDSGPKSLFHSQYCYVNCLIYLVCSVTQLRPTTPTVAGDS